MRARTLHAVKGPAVSDDNELIDGIPDARAVSITPFSGDEMFQRWLIDKIYHRKELEFIRVGLPNVVGFLTGLDDTAYSVSTTGHLGTTEAGRHDIVSRVLNRADVKEIGETGRSSHEFDRASQARLRRYTRKLWQAAECELIPSRRVAAAMAPNGRDRVPQEKI